MVCDGHICKWVWWGSRRGTWLGACSLRTPAAAALLPSDRPEADQAEHRLKSVRRDASLSQGSVWPTTCLPQSELGAEEGEVQGCGAMSTWEGVGGFLRAGPAAAAAPQCQLQPGQGLHHETHHQLPAHEEAAQHWSVSVVVIPVGAQCSVGHGFISLS